MQNELRHELITANNLELAVFVQNTIFPHYSAKTNYQESLSGKTNNIYWLIYDGDTCIGVSGLYYYDIDPTSAWLGWFGILPQYQNKGYGSKSLTMFMNEARDRKFECVRLYTDEIDNADAVNFYIKKGMVSEPYLNPDDVTRYTGQILIFSKSLSQKKLAPWNNLYMGFGEQLTKQEKV